MTSYNELMEVVEKSFDNNKKREVFPTMYKNLIPRKIANSTIIKIIIEFTVFHISKHINEKEFKKKNIARAQQEMGETIIKKIEKIKIATVNINGEKMWTSDTLQYYKTLIKYIKDLYMKEAKSGTN